MEHTDVASPWGSSCGGNMTTLLSIFMLEQASNILCFFSTRVNWEYPQEVSSCLILSPILSEEASSNSVDISVLKLCKWQNQSPLFAEVCCTYAVLILTFQWRKPEVTLTFSVIPRDCSLIFKMTCFRVMLTKTLAGVTLKLSENNQCSKIHGKSYSILIVIPDIHRSLSHITCIMFYPVNPQGSFKFNLIRPSGQVSTLKQLQPSVLFFQCRQIRKLT